MKLPRIKLLEVKFTGFDGQAILKRLGVVAAVAVAQLVTLVKTTGKLPTVAEAVVIAGTSIIAGVPAGAAPAGILTPAQPGGVSLAQAAVQSVAAVIAAPAANRAAVAAQAVSQAVQEAKPQIISDVLAGLTAHGTLSAEQLAAAHALIDAKAAGTVIADAKAAPVPVAMAALSIATEILPKTPTEILPKTPTEILPKIAPALTDDDHAVAALENEGGPAVS